MVRQMIHMALWRDEEGASAVEYGIMVALIAAIIVAAVATLGKAVTGLFESVLPPWG